VPLHRSRADQFDQLVLDAVQRLEKRWERELRGMEFAVEDVPSLQAQGGERYGGQRSGAGGAGPQVPLARAFPPAAGMPARVVLYRRPIETRAPDRLARAALVHDVVVEQVADLLGLEPETVDPRYEGPE
jgi:predicted Zn-dependent protease with MMP-like domain